MDSTIFSAIVLALFSAGITIFYSRHTKRLADDQMMKELFKDFNCRYDHLNQYLEKVKEMKCANLEEFDKNDENGFLKNKVIDFFNLCAEEYYWSNHKKRIDPIVWKSWHKGMNYWYNDVIVINKLWDKEIESNGTTPYYILDGRGFFSKKLPAIDSPLVNKYQINGHLDKAEAI